MICIRPRSSRRHLVLGSWRNKDQQLCNAARTSPHAGEHLPVLTVVLRTSQLPCYSASVQSSLTWKLSPASLCPARVLAVGGFASSNNG